MSEMTLSTLRDPSSRFNIFCTVGCSRWSNGKASMKADSGLVENLKLTTLGKNVLIHYFRENKNL